MFKFLKRLMRPLWKSNELPDWEEEINGRIHVKPMPKPIGKLFFIDIKHKDQNKG